MMTSIAYLSYTVTACTITAMTSGTPLIPGYAAYHGSDFCWRVDSAAFQAMLTAPPPLLGFAPIRQVQRVWCAACRGLVPSASVQDARLGFKGYCGRCVNGLAARCVRENGRLPEVGEFFCPVCPAGIALQPLAQLCAPERDGRRRLRCKECRLNQLRARRKLRRLAAAA